MSSIPSAPNSPNPDKIEARRGGYAVAFIVVALMLSAGFLAKKAGMDNPYLFMAIAVFSMLGGYYLSPYIFSKPLISASHEGLWTRQLQQVPWSAIKDIRIEKTAIFSVKGSGKTDVHLVIETTDHKSDRFNVQYLDSGEEIGHQLIRLWQSTGKKS
ncbi:MAG: hypothetical protein U0T77_01440 [Chitinophagales bacterium]